MIGTLKGKIKWVRSPDCLAVLALFFLSLFFFYDLLGERFLLIERDLGPYFIPPRFFWVESIKHGSFPLWNPYQFSGHPFFANPQHAILYPLNSLFFLLPFDIAFNAIIILHFFLGGLFTYLLLKDLKVNSTGALISGLIFMLSGYLLSVHSLLTILLSSIWTPFIMLFFRRAVISPGFKNEILTAIFITLSFLGGGIEIVYGNFFVLLFMAIFSSIIVPHSSVKEGVGEPLSGLPGFGRLQRAAPTRFVLGTIFYRVRSLFIISILFLFLSAIQLFPFVELFHHSIRGNGISYQEATTWSFAPKDILLFFLPDAYGYFLDMKKYWVSQCWFKTLYTGGLPFILSVIFFIFGNPVGEPLSGLPQEAATEGRHYSISSFHRGRRLFIILILFSLFLSLGKYNPLYTLVFKYVPFFNGIRYPAKFLYIFILVLSITAGLGFQSLFELSKESGEKRFKNIFIIFSLISGLFLLILVLGHKEIEHFLKLREIDFPQFNLLTVNLYNAKRFFFYLALFFLLIRVGHEVKWKSWVKILLILFLIADLFGNMGYYGKEKTENLLRNSKSLEVISSDKGNYRLFSTAKTISMDTTVLIDDPTYLGILKERNLPSMNLFYSLHDIWGVDVIRVKRTDDLYKTFISTPSISATHLIDLYGVKYITSVTPLEEDHKFELIYARLEGLQGKREDLLKENTIKLYKNPNFLPRAWFVKDFKVLDSKTILSMMTQKEFDPGQEVFLEEEPKWASPPDPLLVKGGKGGLKEPLYDSQNKGGSREPPPRRAGDVGEPLGGLSQKVEIISESNNRLRLQVETAEDSLLVLSDTYYPGWKAFVYPVRYDSYNQGNLVDTNLSYGVDGKEVKIYRANYNFRAIPVEAGEHEIKFIYDPISFKIGALASLLAGIGMVVYFIKVGHLKSRSKDKDVGEPLCGLPKY